MSVSCPPLQFLDCGDFRLSYREAGAGVPIVFIHGMGGNSANWTSQYACFSDSYRVIGWDAPGYGESDDWDNDLPSAGDYALLIAEFLDGLQIKEVHLVGHSYGGIMVTAFYRSFRERVLSLTLAEPVVGGGVDNFEERSKTIRNREKELGELGVEGYAKLHAPRSCSPNADLAVIERAIQVTRQMRPKGYLTQFRSLRHANIFEWAIRPRIPSMIIGGQHDSTADSLMLDSICEKMSGSIRYEIPNIGHMFYLENPDKFNALYNEFLKAHF
jgi:pimeloyl-ACP methyl ester carboxylesterase